MNRREAIKTMACLPAAADGTILGKSDGVTGTVRVLFARGRRAEYTTSRQCVNDFARDAARRHPDALEIHLELGDLKIAWLRYGCNWILFYNYPEGPCKAVDGATFGELT